MDWVGAALIALSVAGIDLFLGQGDTWAPAASRAGALS
jgi:hypothetical protein